MALHPEHRALVLRDILLLGVSIAVAVILVRTNVLAELLLSVGQMELLGSFIAGFFFTSIFTTAPAIVALGEIARVHDVVTVAAVGAVGAAAGDFFIFRFIRDSFASHVFELVRHRDAGRRIKIFLHRRLFRWASFFVGGLILASPLPDELGISLLGFSNMKTSWFVFFSLIFNFIGILIIGMVANAL